MIIVDFGELSTKISLFKLYLLKIHVEKAEIESRVLLCVSGVGRCCKHNLSETNNPDF